MFLNIVVMSARMKKFWLRPYIAVFNRNIIHRQCESLLLFQSTKHLFSFEHRSNLKMTVQISIIKHVLCYSYLHITVVLVFTVSIVVSFFCFFCDTRTNDLTEPVQMSKLCSCILELIVTYMLQLALIVDLILLI